MKSNYQKIFEDMKRDAENGDMDAAEFIGKAYMNGEGCEKDYDKAIKYLTIAANAGCVGAAYNLVVIYLMGDKLSENKDKVIYYIKMVVMHDLAEERSKGRSERQRLNSEKVSGYRVYTLARRCSGGYKNKTFRLKK